MTLIECFTEAHIDNMAACLRLQPEAMILVGPAKKMDYAVPCYRKLLAQRGQTTKIVTRDVNGKDFGDICAVLEELIRREAEYVIDLTGGGEMVIMAVGAVYQSLDSQQRQHVQVQKYDHRQEAFLDCLHDNRVIPGPQVELSVEELILLHGGMILPDSYQPPRKSESSDVTSLWKFTSANPRDWNQKVNQFSTFEKYAQPGTHVYLKPGELEEPISDCQRKEEAFRELLSELDSCGVLNDRSRPGILDYTYPSELLRYCTNKAGNTLEVKTLLEGRAALNHNIPLFQDGRMSVSIDWDGVIKDFENHPETRNEIDVVLMHGLTPLFISCKNGDIGEEELYKLHTVATRFGGPHVRKMLIATKLSQYKAPKSRDSLMQRAEDMDILLITDASKLSGKGWQELFHRAIRKEQNI